MNWEIKEKPPKEHIDTEHGDYYFAIMEPSDYEGQPSLEVLWRHPDDNVWCYGSPYGKHVDKFTLLHYRFYTPPINKPESDEYGYYL